VNVYVLFDRWGRMGNRMFQFAFGHLLALKRNTRLYSNGLPNFNIPDTINTEQLIQPVNPIYTRGYGDNHVDSFELAITGRDVIVNSFVQKSKYFEPYCQNLRDIFNIDTKTINQGKLILHIRETDYVGLNHFLGYDYYKKLINDSGFTDVIIVTDNSESETVKKLISEGCILNTPGIVETFNTTSDDRAMQDFNTLLYSENIATSQSSFSWWAAFLGNHKKIIMPYKTKGGMWKINPEIDDIDLFINRAEVIKYIND